MNFIKKYFSLFLILNLILLLSVIPAGAREKATLFYEDFSGWSPGIQSQTQMTGSGYKPYSYVEGQYEIKSENGNKFLRLRSPDGNTGYPLWRISISESSFMNAGAIIVEYRVRNNLFVSSKAVMRSRTGSTYGTNLPSFTKGGIYSAYNSSTKYGNYEPNEWVTVTNILYTAPNSSGKAVRGVLINGKNCGTVTENIVKQTNDYVNFADNLYINFNLIYCDKSPTEYFDIDYISIYTDGDTFNIKGEDTAKTDSIILESETPLNPSYLATRSRVYDEDGNYITMVNSAQLVQGENEGKGYRIKANFYKPLEFGKKYTLKTSSNVTDFLNHSGNFEFTFETVRPDFVYGDVMIEKRTENGKTYAKASFNADNNTESAERLTVVFGGYKTEDGAYKMIRGSEKYFDFKGPGQYFQTDEAEITGADTIQCMIWQGNSLISVAVDQI